MINLQQNFQKQHTIDFLPRSVLLAFPSFGKITFGTENTICPQIRMWKVQTLGIRVTSFFTFPCRGCLSFFNISNAGSIITATVCCGVNFLVFWNKILFHYWSFFSKCPLVHGKREWTTIIITWACANQSSIRFTSKFASIFTSILTTHLLSCTEARLTIFQCSCTPLYVKLLTSALTLWFIKDFCSSLAVFFSFLFKPVLC